MAKAQREKQMATVKQYKEIVDHYKELLTDTMDPEERFAYLAYIIEANNQIEHISGDSYITLSDDVESEECEVHYVNG